LISTIILLSQNPFASFAQLLVTHATLKSIAKYSLFR
jgi:hypothetical protein